MVKPLDAMEWVLIFSVRVSGRGTNKGVTIN